MKSKLNRFKQWIAHPFVVCVVLAILAFAILIFCAWNFTPTYFAEATVTDIGYKGITVTYKGMYGREVLQAIDVDDPSEYRIGEIITIQIYDGGGIKGIVTNNELV